MPLRPERRQPRRRDGQRPAGRESPLFVNALARGLAVLESFGDSWEPLGVREIAARSGLGVPAAQRAIFTLVELGYLHKDERTGRCRLTPRALDLASRYCRGSPLYEVAIPVVIALRDQVNETITVSVLDGAEAVVMIRMPSPRRIDPTSAVGRRMPAHCTSTGRAMLAWLPAGARDAALPGERLAALTPHTLTDRADIEARLERARADGYALVDEEAGLAELGLGAPVLDGAGQPVAALGVSLSKAEWSAERARGRLAPAVMRAASAITRALQGWKPF